MGTPDQRFSPLENTLNRSELKGINRKCAEKVSAVKRNARYQAMKSMAQTVGPFDKSIERACHDIAGMLLDALPSNAAYTGCRGLIDHAAHTRDVNELIRITEALARKGRLA